MSYYKKIIILSQIAKSGNGREATGFVKLERIAGEVTGRVALLNIMQEGLHLGVKCKNLPLQTFAIDINETETVFSLHTASRIEDAICIVARETAAGFSPVMSGSAKHEQAETLALSFVKRGGNSRAAVNQNVVESDKPLTSASLATEAAVEPTGVGLTAKEAEATALDTTVSDTTAAGAAAEPPKTATELKHSAPPVYEGDILRQGGAVSAVGTDIKDGTELSTPFSEAAATRFSDDQIAETNYYDLHREAAATLADGLKPRTRTFEYYKRINKELEELFSLFPPEETLNKIIDSSYFVRINYVDDKYYAVGLISAGDEPQYIVYAVPGVYSTEPPAELKDSCKWMPVKYSDYTGEGYWVMYQDTDTGETVVDIV